MLATRVPEPCLAVSQPSAPSWAYASATVLRAIPRSAASVRDDGSRVPGASRPGLHGLAKRRLQPGPYPVPGQFQVQVYTGNGPCFSHKSGA